MPILEQDAADIAANFDSLPEDKKPVMAGILRDYRDQQDRLNQPLWPNAEKQALDRQQKFRSMFTELKNVDAVAPSLSAGLRFSQDPDADRARVANTVFLARAYQKPADEISRALPLYMRDYAANSWDEWGDMDHKAFHAKASQEVQGEVEKEKLLDETHNAATSAALLGHAPGDVLGAWQAEAQGKPGFVPSLSQEWLAAHKRITDRISPYTDTINGSLADLQASYGVKKDGKPVEGGKVSAADVAQRLLDVPERDRALVIKSMIARAEASGADSKGFLQQLGESFARGAEELGIGAVTPYQRMALMHAKDALKTASVPVDSKNPVQDAIGNVFKPVMRAAIGDPASGGGLADAVTTFATAHRSLTPEEQKQGEASIARALDAVDLAQTIRQVADGSVDPVKGDYFLTRSLYGSARMAPMIAASLNPASTWGVVAPSFAESNYQKLLASNPGMSKEAAMQVASVTAPLEQAIYSMHVGGLLGKMPALQRFAQADVGASFGSVATRYLARTVADVGAGSIAMKGAELVRPALQSLASKVSEDIPGVDWGKEFEQWTDGGKNLEMIGTLLPYALLGAKGVTSADIQRTRTAQGMESIGAALGMPADGVKAATAAFRAGDMETAEKAWQDAWGKRGAVDVEAVKRLAKDGDLGAKALIINMQRAGVTIEKTGDQWAVRTKEGGEAKFDTHDEAFAAFKAHADALDIKADDNLMKTFQVFSEGAKDGEAHTLSGRDSSLLDYWDEASKAGDQRTLDDIWERANIERERSGLERVTPDKMTPAAMLSDLSVLGQSVVELRENVAGSAGRVYRSIVNRQGTAIDHVEEKAEGDVKQWFDSGRITPAAMAELIRNVEVATGDTYLHGDSKTAVIEAYSQLARLYVTGTKGGAVSGAARSDMAQQTRAARLKDRQQRERINKAAGDEQAKPLIDKLKQYAQYFREVFKRVGALMKAQKEGKLGDVEKYLMESVGLSEDHAHAKGVQEFASKLAENGLELDAGNSAFSLAKRERITEPEFVTPKNAPDVVDVKDIGISRQSQAETAKAGREWLKENGESVASRIPEPFLLSARGLGKLKQVKFDAGEDAAAHFQAVAMLPELLQHSETLARTPDRDGSSNVAFYERRYAWAVFPDGSRRHVLLTARHLTEATEPPRMYSLEALEVRNASEAFNDGKPREQSASSSAATGLDQKLSEFMAGVKPEHKSDTPVSFSIAPSDRINAIAEALGKSSDKPEQRRNLLQRAKDLFNERSADWIPLIENKRTLSNISKERNFREASAYAENESKLMGERMSPNMQAALDSADLAKLKNHPLVEAILGNVGKLMSRTEALKSGKLVSDGLKAGDYDGAPRLPSWMYGGSKMPDQVAQELHDMGMLKDAYPDTLWAELGKAIESTSQMASKVREANAVLRGIQKDAREAAVADAEKWQGDAIKKATSKGADRERLVASMRTLDAVLAALPSELRSKVGGFIQLARLSTDAARIDEIQRRAEKIGPMLEGYFKKVLTDDTEKLFDRFAAKGKSGEKPKGKIGAEAQSLMDAAKKAMDYSGDARDAELARLDKLISGGTLTPEQEALARREAEIVSLFGDWKSADAAQMQAAYDAIESTVKGGYLDWKTRLIAKAEARAEARVSLKDDTGTTGAKTERQEQEEQAKTLLGKARNMALSLSSFHEVVSYVFGRESKQGIHLVDSERKAAYQYEDAIQAMSDSVSKLFTKLAGGELAGEKLRFDLSQKSIDAKTEKLSQLEAIQALLIWNQADGRRHMEGPRDEDGKPLPDKWAYDQAWVDNVASQLTPEAREVMRFIQQTYAGEWATLNPYYRERHGVNLPHHDNYAPLTVKPQQASGAETTDPITGMPSTGSILTPGSLRTRNRTATAEPEFRDALQTLIGHTKQMEYWKAYYDFAVDAQAILGNREVGNAIEAKAGKSGLTVLRKWVDAFAQGGFRDAAEGVYAWSALQRAIGRASTAALFGRVSTLLVQSTQLAAASVEMPVTDYLSRFSGLMTGQLGWGDAMKSDFIQRRLVTMPPLVRQAMESLAAAKRPNEIKHLAGKVGELLNGADALFTAGTYAMLLDYHRANALEIGMKGAEAEAWAKTEAERATERVAQPTRMGQRSLMEITNTAPLSRAMWAFASESRQKLSMMAWAAANAGKNPAYAAKVAFLTVVVGGLLPQVIKNLWREAKGDDDQRKWAPQRLIVSMLSQVYSAVPGGSMAVDPFLNPGDNSGLLSGGARVPSALKHLPDDLSSGDTVHVMQDVESIFTAAALFNDTAAGISSLSHAGVDGAKLLQHLFTGESTNRKK